MDNEDTYTAPQECGRRHRYLGTFGAHKPADRRNHTQKALANLKTAARERFEVDHRTTACCSIRDATTKCGHGILRGRRDPVILSDEEYERLLKARKDRDMLGLYVLALGETGGRCESEILWIQWDDIDLEGGFLKIVTGRNGRRTKRGKSQRVPISPRLRQALREHSLRYRAAKYDGQPSPWVFHHTKTRRHHKAGERIRSLYNAFKAAAEQAKLPRALVDQEPTREELRDLA